MTGFEIIILIAAIVAIALTIAYNVQRGTKTLKEFKADFDNNKEAQELVELSKELYNKDLRPIVAKKAPKEEVKEEVKEEKQAKTETSIDKPKKKRKYYPKKK